MPAAEPAPHAVVFDMGGVLVELGPLTDLLGNQQLTAEEFWPRWLASPAVRAFEMGRCSIESFGDRLVEDLALDCSGADFVERFARWPRGLFAGAAELIAELHRTPVCVLSNTNALHWDHQIDAATIRGLFDRAYLSHRLGLAKPDAAIFDHVVADLELTPEQILFVDDNQLNVDAARAAGIDAHLARGVAEARAVLHRRGALG